MHNASFFIRYKLHHLLIWLLIFGTWFFLRYEDFSLPATAFKITLVKVVDLALMVYLTNYLLIPKLLYKKKYILFALAFIVLITTSSLVKMNVLGRIMNNPNLLSFSGNWKARIYDNVIPHFFLVLAGVAFKLMFDFIEMQKKMAEMAKEKAEAELSFLKSQINPHFLFNSLNAVYFLIDKENKEAREALHRFSEMLRYQLYEAGGNKIPIEKEIDFLKDYVHLQKLRKDENYKVEFNTSAEVKGFSIEPLLLLSFVENAFKHISHKQDAENFVNIHLHRSNGQMLFDVTNSKEEQLNAEMPGGIGLKNVQRRLELLYPGKYELQIENKPEIFKVHLKLKL
ncbi:histidine kinase [Lacibacter sp. MH-610]|uniref:sensor histidine kinase n=1 Tax=Lacibacter sp. MH-610 TaxID=3020883 RepID=UPI003891C6F3